MRHDPDEKAGISNLIEILSVVTGEGIAEIEARYDGGGYGTFKADVGEAVVAVLDPIRRATRSCAPTSHSCQRCCRTAPRRPARSRRPTLEQMYERMGFVRP